jgi:hypothetical protein
MNSPIKTTINAARILLLVTCSISPFTSLIAAEGPWRLNDSLGLDEGFTLGLIQRTRFENISDNVQLGASDNDQVLAIRTLLNAQYNKGNFTSQLEFADIRQELADDDSILKSRTVNAADFLQANIGYRFGAEQNTWVRLGRFSEDWGSRRLMARNRFRNTINAFDGLVVHHDSDNGVQTRFMATQVVRRLPGDFASQLDNEIEADESSDAQRFYGFHSSLPNLFDAFTAEVFYYSIKEKDTSRARTRNKDFDSMGFRLRKPPRAGEFEFEIETIFQKGERHGSTASTDITKLDHRAYFQYLMLGYSFDVPSNLRLQFELDYASGDNNPFDQDNERFDSLFGPTTFEFAVVGLYDPFNRSNIVTPGVRLLADVTSDISLMASYRHWWLADAQDSWGRTGLRDKTGQSGRYLGQHLQLRLRWDVIPENLRIEAGGVYLDAKNLSEKEPKYFYTSATFTF